MKKSDLEIIAFDLDDTLTLSKMPLDSEMSGLLCELLKRKKVAVASGAPLRQLEKQFLKYLSCPEKNLRNLYLLPTNGADLYKYDGGWREIYRSQFSKKEKKLVFDAFPKAFAEIGYKQPEKIYGILIEDRVSQITFSGLGSDAPLDLKSKWDPDHSKRKKIVEALSRQIPGFSISIGGKSSIDITQKGIDKAYGLTRLMEYLHCEPERLLYVGDALFPGGNDASVMTLRVKYALVEGPGVSNTKKLIKKLLTVI